MMEYSIIIEVRKSDILRTYSLYHFIDKLQTK